MGKNSAIAWTDHTFNPWWGCAEVSPGCQHCYARGFANRVGFGSAWNGDYRSFNEKHWNEPLMWDRAAREAGKTEFVFCGSMCDILDHRAPEGARQRLFALAHLTPHLTWLFLTKRTESLELAFPVEWYERWPKNIWIGYTAENNDYLKRRSADVERFALKVGEYGNCYPIIFISAEPLLGPLADLHDVLKRGLSDWVIAGGESGPGARPMHPDWARSIRDECRDSGVSFFFKQWGEWLPFPDCTMPDDKLVLRKQCYVGPLERQVSMYRVGKEAAGRLLDGVEHSAFPEGR